MTTGQIIKFLREERGMTQEQLAELMGYSHKSSINKIEMGKSDLPQSKLVAFAKVFGVDPCELLGIGDEQKKLWDVYNVTDILAEFNPNKSESDIALSNHERTLVQAYRNNPELQIAVDRILNIVPQNEKAAAKGDSVSEIFLPPLPK